MKQLWPIFKREFAAYFATPLAYVFIVIFLFATSWLTFKYGRFFDSGVADLSTFFQYHPWLYLFLIPAVAMRLWAEERQSGTIELLLTLPVPLWVTVLGKFLAAWAFAGVALLLTFPIWITVNWLGGPDNGVILAGYIGSFLMAGAYLSIGAFFSATTKNQVIAFVVTVVVCFLFTIPGYQPAIDYLRDWLPGSLLDSAQTFSFLKHFASIVAGVIDLRDVIFFFSLIALFLTANIVVIDLKKTS